eukprot:scaffold5581_cov229-Prasinococcus_capsulatus_cf.AAC.6
MRDARRIFVPSVATTARSEIGMQRAATGTPAAHPGTSAAMPGPSEWRRALVRPPDAHALRGRQPSRPDPGEVCSAATPRSRRPGLGRLALTAKPRCCCCCC